MPEGLDFLSIGLSTMGLDEGQGRKHASYMGVRGASARNRVRERSVVLEDLG